MNLLIDLGNTCIKWTWSQAGTWRPGQRAVFADGVLDRLVQETEAVPARVVGVSVAPAERRDEVSARVRHRWGKDVTWIVSQAQACGVRNGYRDPARLGADRWAALVAARATTTGRICVVDCGTAVTIDALAEDGMFCGGAILPGLGLARRSLVQGTAAILAEAGDAISCLGRSTADAVAGGTLFGLAGAIERVVAEQQRALGGAARLFITGGDADTLAPHLSIPVTRDPDLVLKGVGLIAETVV